MRFSSLTILAALGSFALAQNPLDQLPKCAQTCFGSDYGNCAPLDIGCVCGNTALIQKISCCVFATCTDAERDTTIKFAAGLCQANGVTVNTNPTCSSTVAASGSGSASTSSASVTGATVVSGNASPTTGAAPGITANACVGMGVAMAGFLAAL
ncbi:hypothetical protein EJ04DRAFT_518746 [Polyplosphaeria fusca]|uniref:CFEM domain-containing protein n=1 Tax=Polyplosphaeria fusca TaxID=682080 RepID=A0A9P4R9A0_9PLEO|nr:hypothetical protein EJ04DRAFT_518746 [Polyplosphaeria fusca]